MKTIGKPEESRFRSRRAQLLARLGNDAALISAATIKSQSRDLSYPFSQDTNFYYLTGFEEPGACLLLLGDSPTKKSILYLRDKDQFSERWHGPRLGIRKAKNLFAVDEVRNIDQLRSDLPQLLAPYETLHFSPGTNSELDHLIFELFQTTSGPQQNAPHTLRDVRLLIAEQRFIKDSFEKKALGHSAKITAAGFAALFAELNSLSSERHAAKQLENHFARLGASGRAFPTIVASGNNATCLHHTPTSRRLGRNDLLLIDAGASVLGYAADISRTIPVSGRYSSPHDEVYDIVVAAVDRVIASAKPGISMDNLHSMAVRVITEGLKSIGVLRGNISRLIKQHAYKPFFMHRTGHYLGLDVHDINPLHYQRNKRASCYSRPLVPGTVFTVEPGLYFDARDHTVAPELRGVGIRVEEDVLITNSGCQVLTDSLPRERKRIELLLNP